MAGEGAISSESLKEKLKRELQAEHVEVEDTSPDHCSTSFRVIVVSPQFEGKALLQRHRSPQLWAESDSLLPPTGSSTAAWRKN
ncbi:bolA-like protein 2 isoform X2 [Rhinoderma darwinii]|uniref:bolA-like protein 2 isoform X2 n=1 Tax=Rhinoderma darwinii TaxID=43563 RepID=UPI003F67ABD0